MNTVNNDIAIGGNIFYGNFKDVFQVCNLHFHK